MKTETGEGIPPVTPVYFDSALIAKFYVNEPGRDVVRALAGTAGIVVTSRIAVAEISAAFHRKYREGTVEPRVFKALQGQFAKDLSDGLWRLVSPTEALLDEVRSLFSKLDKAIFLRSIDALHLVTAKAEGFACLYSNDRHLLNACAHLGIEGVNPIA
ncbi:MAG TPA: type II toxin-antitoxin system VapC family toxin [Terriglobia bacterium]|jgi:predicted nucleic acid-binding protein